MKNTKQTLVVKKVERREKRHSSLSFDWMHEKPNKTYYNEKKKISRHQGSNADIIEMMAITGQRMQERKPIKSSTIVKR